MLTNVQKLFSKKKKTHVLKIKFVCWDFVEKEIMLLTLKRLIHDGYLTLEHQNNVTSSVAHSSEQKQMECFENRSLKVLTTYHILEMKKSGIITLRIVL